MKMLHGIFIGGKAQHMVSLFIWTIPAQHIGTLKWSFKVQQIVTPF